MVRNYRDNILSNSVNIRKESNNMVTFRGNNTNQVLKDSNRPVTREVSLSPELDSNDNSNGGSQDKTHTVISNLADMVHQHLDGQGIKISKKDVNSVLVSFNENIAEYVLQHGFYNIKGVGRIYYKIIPPRKGVLKTKDGEDKAWETKARYTLAFKTFDTLRDRIKNITQKLKLNADDELKHGR